MKNTLLTITTLFLLAISVNAQDKAVLEGSPSRFSIDIDGKIIPIPTIKKSDFLKPQPIDTSIWKARGPMTLIATGVCAAGQSTDLISSTGYEANGFLRGANGRINMSKAVSLKLGMCIAPAFLDSKLPKWARVSFRIAQFAVGGIGFYDFTQNRRHNHK